MIYLDTSAALKAILDEDDSAALRVWLAATDDGDLTSAWLLHAELHCALLRRPDAVDSVAVDAILDVVELVDLTRGDLLLAPQVARGLRTLDALHLTVALRIGVDSLVTYDDELAAGAREAGLQIVRPT